MSVTHFRYPQIDMAKTGQRLRAIARKQEIPVKEIQRCLGLASNQAIYDWFNGKTLPTLNNFVALSFLFHTSMEDMLRLRTREISFHLQTSDSEGKSYKIMVVTYIIFITALDTDAYFDFTAKQTADAAFDFCTEVPADSVLTAEFTSERLPEDYYTGERLSEYRREVSECCA